VPFQIVSIVGGIVALILTPVIRTWWFLALAGLFAAAFALVLTLRALLGGERKGQGDAG
jgi:hypothetical protein